MPARQKTFLAVTSDKSTWGGGNVVFMTEEIIDYKKRGVLLKNKNKVLDADWDCESYRKSQKIFLKTKIERYRKEISSKIEAQYNVNFTKLGWKNILDSWLYHFLTIVYDRINYIEYAKNNTKDLCIMGSGNPPSILKDTLEFVTKCREDDTFNQYLYSESAKIIGMHVVDNNKNKRSAPSDSYQFENKSSKFKILRSAVILWIKILKPIVVIDGYFPYKKNILISLLSFGKVIFVPSGFLLDKIYGENKKKFASRDLNLFQVYDKYDELSNQLAKTCLPYSLVEGMIGVLKKNKYMLNAPVIGSAIGFYHDDTYKIISAEINKRGGYILGFQHGGNYNIFNYYIHNYEINSASKYYFWSSRMLESKVRLPATKLDKINNMRKFGKLSIKKNILLVSTIFVKYPMPRYIELQQGMKLFNHQLLFFDYLSGEIKKEIVLRPNPHDNGWFYNDRWVEYTSGDIKFDNIKNYYKSIQSRRLVVVDHLSTTWLEALVLGVPIIIYFDYLEYDIIDSAKNQFKCMESVSIMHKTPEEAAEFINNNYDSIDLWWNNSDTVKVVESVKKHFLNDDSGFVKKWTKELLSVRKEAILEKKNG